MTATRNVYHVVFSEDLWKVRLEGSVEAGRYRTQREAVESAKRLAQHGAVGRVVVHYRDHTVAGVYTYHGEPRPARC